MMSTKQLSVLLLLFTAFFLGCEKEIQTISEESTPTLLLESGAGDFTPDSYCGTAQSVSLLHKGASKGSVSILNTSTDLYLVLDMNQGVFLESIFAQFGPASNAPLDASGNLALEEFDFQVAVSGSGSSLYTIQVPTSEIANCNDILLSAMVSERNHFGQVTSSYQVWIDGTDHLDGFYHAYCTQVCN